MEITGQRKAPSGSTLVGSNTTSMKQTELHSTRQASSRAVSATRSASVGKASPYAWKLVALLSLHEEAQRVLEKIGPNSTGFGANGLHNIVSARQQISSFSSVLRNPYVCRTLVLIVLNIFQASGFYGLVNRLPTLLISRGFTILRSLRYTFIISIVYPLSPLLFIPIADKIERKWHIVLAAGCAAVLGLLFSCSAGSVALVTLGILLTISNNWLSFAYHAYQAEMYPTSMRARGVGFVYSFSRLSTVVSSFLIALLLRRFDPVGVFAFIACSMAIVVVTVGFFGPRTRGHGNARVAVT